MGSSSTESRIEDLHESFTNKDSKAIICATGGYNSNELLSNINWEIIGQNPKVIIGSSDITVLLNAIYAKTGLVTYWGPNFYKFGMELGLEYTIEFMDKCLFKEKPFSLLPSLFWSNDRWYKDQINRDFIEGEGFKIFSEGIARGVAIGGNLCSLNLLQGTEYMPDIMGAILFIEDDDLAGESCFGEFKRNIDSLFQLPNSKSVKGVIVGRFPKNSKMTDEKIQFVLSSKSIPNNIPIIYNVDFGHCDPSITFPIGVEVEIDTSKKTITIIKH
jgi:muramoyltetrapeptide carboxypeptidase LdcA involved in peptidoglycan recycling